MSTIGTTKKSIFRRYRLLPLVVVGLITFVLTCVICLLIWSAALYAGQAELPSGNSLAGVIYFGAIFLSAVLMTRLIRGGTVFPAVIVSLLAVALSLMLTDIAPLSVGSICAKILLSLLTGVAGFTLTKLYFMLVSPMRKLPSNDMFDAVALSEPQLLPTADKSSQN